MKYFGAATAFFLCMTASAATVSVLATASLTNGLDGYCSNASTAAASCELFRDDPDVPHAMATASAGYGYLEVRAFAGDMADAFAVASFFDQITVYSTQMGFLEGDLHGDGRAVLSVINGSSRFDTRVTFREPVDFREPIRLDAYGEVSGGSFYGDNFRFDMFLRLYDSEGRQMTGFSYQTESGTAYLEGGTIAHAPEVSSALAVGTAFALIGLISAVRKRRAHK